MVTKLYESKRAKKRMSEESQKDEHLHLDFRDRFRNLSGRREVPGQAVARVKMDIAALSVMRDG